VVRVSAHQLGHLLLAHAVQLGLRKRDGVKYIPPEAHGLPKADQLRSELRRAIPFFVELAAPCGLDDTGLLLPLEEAVAAPRFWHDPQPSAELAALFLPDYYPARLTRAANLLRAGNGQPALHELQAGLASLPLRREPRARFMRNLAGAYELIGDDAGASWCARRAYEIAPWEQHSLLSHLIYLVLGSHSAEEGAKAAQAAVLGFRGSVCAQELWTTLRQRGARASQFLAQDPDQSNLYREAISR